MYFLQDKFSLEQITQAPFHKLKIEKNLLIT